MYHTNSSNYVTAEILIAVTMKITVFWDVLACDLADCYQCFGETCCHLQGRRVGQAWESVRDTRYRDRMGQNEGHKHTNRRKEKWYKEYLALKKDFFDGNKSDKSLVDCLSYYGE
jgi:hypothetical protein